MFARAGKHPKAMAREQRVFVVVISVVAVLSFVYGPFPEMERLLLVMDRSHCQSQRKMR